MIEVAIMLEGQNGLTWPRWQRMARAVEDLGFVGLYRSDHFTNAGPPDVDSLELWTSLTWLASNTSRIEFAPLVSPVSFRHPTMTVRMATAIDDLSGGRLSLGVGAGWQEREHTNYGWDLLDVTPRMDRFAEALAVMQTLLHNDGPSNFQGEYYQLNEATLLPRPQRPGGPPILIGGNGPKRTLPLVAQYAQEWNAVFVTPERYAELGAKLDTLTEARGRQPADIRRSMMTGCFFGADEAAVSRSIERTGQSADELRERGLVVGNSSQIIDQLGVLAGVGLQRVMLQWLDLDDLDGLEAMAKGVLPQLK